MTHAYAKALTGGLITTVPMTADEATKMGKDLIKKKGGEILSQISGTHARRAVQLSTHRADG